MAVVMMLILLLVVVVEDGCDDDGVGSADCIDSQIDQLLSVTVTSLADDRTDSQSGLSFFSLCHDDDDDDDDGGG